MQIINRLYTGNMLIKLYLLSSLVLSTHNTQAVSSETTRSASVIPDFSSLSVKERKKAFKNTILPLAFMQNRHILKQRTKLYALSKKNKLNKKEMAWLQTTGNNYGLPLKQTADSAWFTSILNRVDILPPSLVLIQAATESAWGTSRFAREGNNYFGMWCYQPGCGLVPRQRATGRTHEVRTFPAISASVEAYYKNINTHAAYKALRQIRAGERMNNRPVTSLKLINGLMNYSERREDYVKSLREWIIKDKLNELDLPPGGIR